MATPSPPAYFLYGVITLEPSGFPGREIKIGISDNPKQRVNQLQTGSPGRLQLVWTLGSQSELLARRLERFILRNTSKLACPGGGEWRQLTDKLVQSLRALQHSDLYGPATWIRNLPHFAKFRQHKGYAPLFSVPMKDYYDRTT